MISKIETTNGIKYYTVQVKDYMEMTEEMLAATITIDNLEMKLGQATAILRPLTEANKRMVEANVNAMEAFTAFRDACNTAAEESEEFLEKFSL